MTVVQFTRFRVVAGRELAALEARRASLLACAGEQPELRRACLVKLGDGEWLDITLWAGDNLELETADPALPSSRTAFFAHVDEVLGEECGLLADDGLGPPLGCWAAVTHNSDPTAQE
jgi:hypothetical protein